MTSRWSRRRDWAALGLLGVAALALTYLLFSSTVAEDTRYWARPLLALVLAFALYAAWINRPARLSSTRVIGSRARGKWFAFLALALFSSTSFAVDVLSLLSPRPATESTSGAIERKVDAIRKALPGQNPASRIRQRITGIWGEQDCAVSFRFAVRGNALTITAEKAPPGRERYRTVATIISDKGDVLEARAEDYRAATFTYWTNGLSEVLSWDDARETPPSKYRRCPPEQ